MLTDSDDSSMDTNELRLRALRQLIGDSQLKDFANQHDLDASYISQILNGHRSFGERAAANMEKKIGLPKDYLARPAVGSDSDTPVSGVSAAAGTSYVAPALAKTIAIAITEGRLNAADIEMLRKLVAHLVKKNEAQTITSVPEKLGGLTDAVFAGSQDGENVDDMLRMLQHGLKKSQPTDSAKKDEPTKKKRSN